MNRKEAKKILPLFKAFSEGKVIQISNDMGEWDDLTEREGLPIGTLREDPNSFRIKSEPKYRPFKNAEECWQEMLKHQPFGWVKDKEDGRLVLITEIDRTGNISLLCNGGWDLDGIKDNFTFADGTPFGLEEE